MQGLSLLLNFNMKKIIFYISCLIIFTEYSSGTVLQFIDTTDIAIQNKIEQNKSLHNADSLYTYFIDNGYLDVSITNLNDTLLISSGSQYFLRNIYLNSLIITKNTTPEKFTKETVTTEIEKTIQNVNKDGYQFATVVVESTVVHDKMVDLFCSLNKGPQVVLDSLIFEGLTKTQKPILHKYITLDDSLITPKLLRTIEKDVREIPFVQFVPPIKQELLQGYQSANLIIPLKERKNILFEGGGGYLSDQDLFLWNISLQFQNMFGAGREISVLSQKKDINHQNLTLEYKQPLFVLGIGSAGFKIQTRDYRDQFYEFVINSQFQTSYKKKFNFGTSAQYKTVEQENNLSYRSAELSLSVSNDKLNLKVKNRTDKLIYDWKLSYGNRKYKNDTNLTISSHSSFNESRFEIKTQFLTPIKNSLMFFISSNLQSYLTNENIPPLAELYLIGGTGSIRGFKDEQFPSIRNLIVTVEPQYQFETGNLFIFYDGGYIYNRTASVISDFDETTIYRYGYGIGLSFLNNSQFLKISFGWNKEVSFDNPRISLLLKTGL